MHSELLLSNHTRGNWAVQLGASQLTVVFTFKIIFYCSFVFLDKNKTSTILSRRLRRSEPLCEDRASIVQIFCLFGAYYGFANRRAP